MTDLPTVAAAITDASRTSAGPLVSGSAIGLHAKKLFRDFDFKQFGGLKSFIAANCPEVVWIKHDSDDLYAHVTRRDDAEHAKTSEKSIRPTPTAWSAFSNPNDQTTLYLTKDTGELTVVKDGDEKPVGGVPITKVSTDEYKSIASSFLTRIPEQSRPSFEWALTQEAFWPAWTRAMAALNNPAVFHEWLVWRYQNIIDHLTKRLTEAGLDSEVVGQILTNFRGSKPRTPPSPPTRPSSTAKPVAPDGLSRSYDIRALAQASVAQMTEEQLRLVWLPLGAFVDALQRSSRK